MARLTQADWKLIRHLLQPFRHMNGVAALLDKVEEHVVEGESEYIKVVRFEFLPNGAAGSALVSGGGDPRSVEGEPGALPDGADAETADSADAECIEHLIGFGCRVLSRDPHDLVMQVPPDGDGFDATIDLLEALYRSGRIRYHR
jgi:hypothetical protein